jgi:tol-pal system protein YbgF
VFQTNQRITAWLGLAAVVGFSGCVTRQDIRGIQTDLYTIQQGIDTRLGKVKDQTDNVQTAQADLSQEIRDLSENLTGLRAELNDYQQRIQQLSSRLDDLESSLTARMDTQIELLSGSKFVEKPLPSTVFNLANTDFVRGKYAEAVTGLRNYIKQFPKGDKVNEARLKIGDSLAKQKDNDGALAAYDEILKESPKDVLAPAALMRKAAVYEAMGRKTSAKEAYMSVIKSYPISNEARAAQERARALQAGDSSSQ